MPFNARLDGGLYPQSHGDLQPLFEGQFVDRVFVCEVEP